MGPIIKICDTFCNFLTEFVIAVFTDSCILKITYYCIQFAIRLKTLYSEVCYVQIVVFAAPMVDGPVIRLQPKVETRGSR